MGTDTMAYAASALSFMLENLGKTVRKQGKEWSRWGCQWGAAVLWDGDRGGRGVERVEGALNYVLEKLRETLRERGGGWSGAGFVLRWGEDGEAEG